MSILLKIKIGKKKAVVSGKGKLYIVDLEKAVIEEIVYTEGTIITGSFALLRDKKTLLASINYGRVINYN